MLNVSNPPIYFLRFKPSFAMKISYSAINIFYFHYHFHKNTFFMNINGRIFLNPSCMELYYSKLNDIKISMRTLSP